LEGSGTEIEFCIDAANFGLVIPSRVDLGHFGEERGPKLDERVPASLIGHFADLIWGRLAPWKVVVSIAEIPHVDYDLRLVGNQMVPSL